MTDGPYYVSGTLSSTVGNLKIGEVGTYVAFYTMSTAYDSTKIQM